MHKNTRFYVWVGIHLRPHTGAKEQFQTQTDDYSVSKIREFTHSPKALSKNSQWNLTLKQKLTNHSKMAKHTEILMNPKTLQNNQEQ